MKKIAKCIFAVVTAIVLAQAVNAQPLIRSQWEGARVAFLGDSITDASQIGTTNDVYWNNLKDILGIEAYVYGVGGHKMDNIVGQAERLESEHGQDVDAIIIFVGTNDFFANVPVGEWYAFSTTDVEVSGPAVQQRRYRELIYDNSTFKGRTNIVMRWLKSHYPDKQIIFLTPLHRGYAYFRADNIQPSESYANAGGYFIDDYVAAIKELANVWAVPVIDLNSISGLYPLSDAQVNYFRNKDTDRLHPNTPGHLRMAWAIAYQLLGYPSRFDSL